MASGNSSIPHDFTKLGESETVIPYGVYYRLEHKDQGGSQHIEAVKGKIFWFPVIGDNPVDFSFTHQWDQADNMSKKNLPSLDSMLKSVTGSASAGAISAIGTPLLTQAQHVIGGGLFLSGCNIFNNSAPPTISISTKLFSMGGNNLISLIEKLRADTHARFGGGTLGGVSAGVIAHPGWWDIKVVSFAGGGGASNVATMKDMICTGMKVTMYSPWLGIEPSYMELRMDFQHGFPGLATSMNFGAGNALSAKDQAVVSQLANTAATVSQESVGAAANFFVDKTKAVVNAVF